MVKDKGNRSLLKGPFIRDVILLTGPDINSVPRQGKRYFCHWWYFRVWIYFNFCLIFVIGGGGGAARQGGVPLRGIPGFPEGLPRVFRVVPGLFLILQTPKSRLVWMEIYMNQRLDSWTGFNTFANNKKLWWKISLGWVLNLFTSSLQAAVFVSIFMQRDATQKKVRKWILPLYSPHVPFKELEILSLFPN